MTTPERHDLNEWGGEVFTRPLLELLPDTALDPLWDYGARDVCRHCRRRHGPCVCDGIPGAMSWKSGDPVFRGQP